MRSWDGGDADVDVDVDVENLKGRADCYGGQGLWSPGLDRPWGEVTARGNDFAGA